jgi:hypothetical protein
MFILRPVHDTLTFSVKDSQVRKACHFQLIGQSPHIRLQSTGGDVHSRCNVGRSSARDKNRVLMVRGLDVIGEAGPEAAHPTCALLLVAAARRVILRGGCSRACWRRSRCCRRRRDKASTKPGKFSMTTPGMQGEVSPESM